MNPSHLTPNVRKQAIEAIVELRKIKKEKNSEFSKTGKAFKNEEDLKAFFNKFFEEIKNEIDNDFNSFLNICVLEDKYGFVSGYMGSGTLNKDGDTTIEIK